MKYSSVGFGTFLCDLLLLYVLIDIFSLHYIFGTACAFIMAVALNYIISRKFVFKGTARSFIQGGIVFMSLASIGLVIILGSMVFCVEVMHWNYLISRTSIAAMVGMCGYLINLYFNFKVVGLHY